MEIKKSKKVELEGQRATRFLIGITVVLAFMFVAFEWTEYDKKIDATPLANDPVFVMTLAPVTYPEQKPPPPPAPVPAPPEELNVVDDTEEVANQSFGTTEELGGGVEIGRYILPEVEEVDKVDETEIFTFVEVMPQFPGGDKAMMEFLSKNIKYPTIPQENGTQGRVVVQFVVDKDGSITNPEIARGVDPYLDREALRVISSMPKWKPGMQRNTPVRVKYTLPVYFKLQGL